MNCTQPQIDLFGESTRGNLHFASSDEDDRPPVRRRIDDVLGLRCAAGWLVDLFVWLAGGRASCGCTARRA